MTRTHFRIRKNRITGTSIQVIDNRGGHVNDDRVLDPVTGAPTEKMLEPWLIECIDHGMYSSHTTRKLAEYHSAVPEWCEPCWNEVQIQREMTRSGRVI